MVINYIKWVKFLLIVSLSGGVIIAGGYLNKSFKFERASFTAELSGGAVKPVHVDISRQGLPKRLLQPGRIIISTGHGNGGIANRGKNPVNLAVRMEGLKSAVKINSKDKSFNSRSGVFEKSLAPGEEVPLSLEIDIPRKNINPGKIENARLVFYDRKGGKNLAVIPVEIVNSSS